MTLQCTVFQASCSPSGTEGAVADQLRLFQETIGLRWLGNKVVKSDGLLGKVCRAPAESRTLPLRHNSGPRAWGISNHVSYSQKPFNFTFWRSARMDSTALGGNCGVPPIVKQKQRLVMISLLKL